MNPTPVTIERRGHVLLMGFDQPAKRNAFGLDTYLQLAAAYGLLDADPELRFRKTQHFDSRERVESQIELQIHRHIQRSGIRFRLSDKLSYHGAGAFFETRMFCRGFPANR